MQSPLQMVQAVQTDMKETPIKHRRYFGTDGIRGRVGIAPITPEFVLKLGCAVGKVLARQGHGKVLIGKDTRISGYVVESALQAGLSSAGVHVQLLGPMPTPAVATAAIRRRVRFVRMCVSPWFVGLGGARDRSCEQRRVGFDQVGLVRFG